MHRATYQCLIWYVLYSALHSTKVCILFRHGLYVRLQALVVRTNGYTVLTRGVGNEVCQVSCAVLSAHSRAAPRSDSDLDQTPMPRTKLPHSPSFRTWQHLFLQMQLWTKEPVDTAIQVSSFRRQQDTLPPCKAPKSSWSSDISRCRNRTHWLTTALSQLMALVPRYWEAGQFSVSVISQESCCIGLYATLQAKSLAIVASCPGGSSMAMADIMERQRIREMPVTGPDNYRTHMCRQLTR